MVEVMNIEFKLEEALTNEPIANARVTAVSEDGLGNVTLAASNETGKRLRYTNARHMEFILGQI